MSSVYHKNWRVLTSDEDMGVGKDGAVLVRGPALVHCSVTEPHILQGENSSFHNTARVWVYICIKRTILHKYPHKYVEIL